MKSLDIITLLNLPGFGRKTVHDILKHSPHSISTPADLIDILNERKKENPRIMVPGKTEITKACTNTRHLIEESAKNGIQILDLNHPNFPKRLRNIPDAPVLIYAKGNIGALNIEKTVAIVGTRQPTDYGMKAGEKVASLFARNKYVIVSGLAVGCDTAAHRGCMKENGITVAIMAGGLDKIYPKINSSIAQEILEKNGCLISEYPVGTSPRSNYFIARDRLQSGLSQAVIVIETGLKGGTMHTARFALKQKRILACLTGHPLKYKNHPEVQGNKMLVGEGKAVGLGTEEEIEGFIKVLAHTGNLNKSILTF